MSGTAALPSEQEDFSSSSSPLAWLDRWVAWTFVLAPPSGAIAALVAAYRGLAPTWFEGLLVVVLYVSTMLGFEIGFHRLIAHRSFQAPTWVRVGLAILGSMALMGPPMWWTATHRRHHGAEDEQGDPHTPNRPEMGLLRGLFHAHIGWLLWTDSTRSEGWRRVVPDLYRDRALVWVDVRAFTWFLLTLGLPAAAGWAWHGSWQGAVLGLLWGGFVRLFLANHVVFWSLNSFGHRFGSRPFPTRDHSTNIGLLAVPTFGESWHNNHHAFPSSAFLSFHWWQLDPAGGVIWLMEKVGLAWDVRRPDRELIRGREHRRSRV